MEHFIEYDGLERNEHSEGPMVRIFFSAGGWVPYSPATWEQPAEGGLFEDVCFLRCEVDARDVKYWGAELSAPEIQECRSWFESSESAQSWAQNVAKRDLDIV